jgi:hypothetical protein
MICPFVQKMPERGRAGAPRSRLMRVTANGVRKSQMEPSREASRREVGEARRIKRSRR